MNQWFQVCVRPVVVPTCVWRGVPDVAVKNFSKDVEDADDRRHDAEEEDSSERRDALQHRVDPHPCHLVHPARPGGGGGVFKGVKKNRV